MGRLLTISVFLFSLATVIWATETTTKAPPRAITKEPFGEIKGANGVQKVTLYTLSNKNKFTVKIMDYGATITSIMTPDRKGEVKRILLGYDDLASFQKADKLYLGATIGRVTNRISGGKFTLNGKTYELFKNDGPNSIHGGKEGFNKKLFKSRIEDQTVVMEYTSPDGEEGYPGEVKLTIRFTLLLDGRLVIDYKATTTKATPINLTNHGYFNLAGDTAGAQGLYNHVVSIFANEYTPVDANTIPTGQILKVVNTPFDLRRSVPLGAAINATKEKGFDINYIIQDPAVKVRPAARVVHPESGRYVEVNTDQPGLQFYTGNSISDPNGRYVKHGAFCLESQKYPDSVNKANFPTVIVNPGQTYSHVVHYKFGALAK